MSEKHDDLQFDVKETMASGHQVYLLGNIALKIFDNKSEQLDEVFYADIIKVYLFSKGGCYYYCSITTKDNKNISFSTDYAGKFHFYNLDDIIGSCKEVNNRRVEYKKFLIELHKKLLPHQKKIIFSKGPGKIHTIGLGIILFIVGILTLFIVIVMIPEVKSLNREETGNFMSTILTSVMAFLGSYKMFTALSGKYKAEAIPIHFLPKETESLPKEAESLPEKMGFLQ